ncbi:hypothetical protein ACLB2K_040514 [Fragaria x ananassa]
MSSMVGRCPVVMSRTDEGTDGTPPSESVDLRRQQSTTQEDEEMPNYDDESLQQQYFHQMRTGLFNGKEFSKLCLDDLKDVYFPTVLEAEQFYYLYSRIVRFSVRRSMREMDENGRVIRRRWVCSKERKSPGQTRKKKGQDVNLQAKAWEKSSRKGLMSKGVRYTRVGCPVEFAVRYCSEKGMYRVRHFVHKHSHELAQPNEVHFLRSNRNVEDRDVAQVLWLRGAQVHTSRAFEKLVE